MRLEVDEIAAACGLGALEEVVETGLEDLRGRGIGRNVTAELAISLVRAHHHDERIPAQDCGEPLLERDIPRVRRLALEWDAVLVGGERQYVRHDPELLRPRLELREEILATRLARPIDDRGERLHPLGRFGRIAIRLDAHAPL